jgi:hypothetical protein
MLQDLDGQILERRELEARRHSNYSTYLRIISNRRIKKTHMATWDDLPPELVANYNTSVCFEHMHQFSRAYEAARAATRAAAAALPPDASLLLRLQRVEQELNAKEAKQLQQAGVPAGCSRAQRAAQRALPPRLADPAFRPKFGASVREPTPAEAEAAALIGRLSVAEAQQLRRKEPLSRREPIASVLTTSKGLDVVSGISPVRRTSLDAPNSSKDVSASELMSAAASRWGAVGSPERPSEAWGRGMRGAGLPPTELRVNPGRKVGSDAWGGAEAVQGLASGVVAARFLPAIVAS